jgi:hypothetical protein
VSKAAGNDPHALASGPRPGDERGPETVRAARSALDTCAQVFRYREQEIPGVREVAEYIASPGSTGAPPPALLERYPHLHSSHPLWGEVAWRAGENAVFRVWSRSRTVYAPDPDLLAELTGSTSSPVPVQVLDRLPHPDPYVLLRAQDPGERQSAEQGKIGMPLGAFVFGRRRVPARPGTSPFARRPEGDLLCSSADERREDLGLMFTSMLQRPDGTPAVNMMKVSLRLRGKELLTVEQMVSSAVEGFRFNHDLPSSERDRLHAWLCRYVGQVVWTLLYCCTDDPDMTAIPGPRPPGKKDRPRTAPGQAQQLVGIGYRLGPAITAARRQSQEQRAPGTGDGRSPRPHWRRCHLHTYWTGPGRTEPKVNLLLPFVVNKKLLGGQTLPVTVHPVRRAPGRHREPPGQAPGG